MFSERPTGLTLCFSHVNAIIQSFFHKFLYIGLRKICLRGKVLNLISIICPLPLGINLTDKLKATFSYAFTELKAFTNVMPPLDFE